MICNVRLFTTRKSIPIVCGVVVVVVVVGWGTHGHWVIHFNNEFLGVKVATR